MNSAKIKIELFRKIKSTSLDSKIELALREIKKGNYKPNSQVMSAVKTKFRIH